MAKSSKPKVKYYADYEIRNMSYNQLGKMVSSGEISMKRLKSYYTSARRTAMQRTKRVQKSEFAKLVPPEYFRKVRNLVTTSDLLHEITDVSRYLRSKSSTITGLRKSRTSQIDYLQSHGFEYVNESNYFSWIKFIQWFKGSAYSAMYDSDEPQVEEVFSMAEQGSPEEWERLFKSFVNSGVSGDEDNSGE